jgi:hypothetical protein
MTESELLMMQTELVVIFLGSLWFLRISLLKHRFAAAP